MIFGNFGNKRIDEALRMMDAQLTGTLHDGMHARKRLAAAEAALSEATRRADIAQANFDWARVRMNQLEAQNAQLLSLLLKTPIGAMEIARSMTSPDDIGQGVPNYPGISFDDLGDQEAERMGLFHDGEGRVTTDG